jgi:hypothetical protein
LAADVEIYIQVDGTKVLEPYAAEASAATESYRRVRGGYLSNQRTLARRT